jgi:hypothetical protein
MKCWHCNEELIWGGDDSFEDWGLDGEGIVSNFVCSNEKCEVTVFVHLPLEPIRIKCKKPLVHKPQFEGKIHCKRCEAEQTEMIE